jgi:hypothetical protein
MGLPADFLIGADGRIIAVKCGKRIDDQTASPQGLLLLPDPRTLQVSDRSQPLGSRRWSA